MPLAKSTAQQGVPDPFEQVVSVFANHIDVQKKKEHYIVGLALWALHTHFYGQYSKSPRLAILSPVPNCGKSTVLDILGALVRHPHRTVDITPSSLFRLAGNHTLLLDEVDNMSIIKSVRALLNDGHSAGGQKTLTETVDGIRQPVTYPLYGPVALAGIGKLPATLMSRSLVVRLHRSDKEMQKFRPGTIYLPDLWAWKEQVVLNPDPFVPPQLIGREADKWRPLFAIAESFGKAMLAYQTAAEFLKEGNTPDVKESVLRDTEKVFNRLKAKVLTVNMLYEALKNDEDGEYEVDYTEQKITTRQLGNYLADFQIKSQSYRYKGGKNTKCWFREDFEDMWKRYA